MLLIDNELELRADLTFEDFTKTSFYAGRRMERNGAGFVLGGFGARHTIKHLEGGYYIDMVFQDTLQRVSIDRDYTNLVSANTTDKCDSQFFAELLRDELVAKGFAEEKQVSVCGDPHYADDYSVCIEYNEYDPEFYKTHDIWAD